MGEFLKEFLCDYENDISNLKSIVKENNEIDASKKRLKQKLTKKQKSCY